VEHCDECGELTEHQVLTGKLITRGNDLRLSGTLRCGLCRTTGKRTIVRPLVVEVNAVVSDGGRSQQLTISLRPEAEVGVDDILLTEEYPVKVTAIEISGPDGGDNRRVELAVPEEVVCLWTMRYDRILLKLAVQEGEATRPVDMRVEPEREFEVGQELKLGKERVRIKSLVTRSGPLDQGGATAGEIKRVWCEPLVIKKERGKWKDRGEWKDRRGDGRGRDGGRQHNRRGHDWKPGRGRGRSR
jgi:uncharacterized Zn finger protein